MCIAFIALGQVPGLPLVIAANRDETHARPAEPLQVWGGDHRILAGRDLQGGGTWLGVSAEGRIALLTNHRRSRPWPADAASRGELVLRALRPGAPLRERGAELLADGQRYAGFHLLLGELGAPGEVALLHLSNVTEQLTPLPPGLYGLSNGGLGLPWFKVERGLAGLRGLGLEAAAWSADALHAILRDETRAPASQLPETGLGAELEARLSSIFIPGEVYGTRCSTMLWVDASGELRVEERGPVVRRGARGRDGALRVEG